MKNSLIVKRITDFCFSVQHLKDRYGQGYTVIIKLKRDLVDTKEDVQRAFELAIAGGATLRDTHELVLDYHVTDPKLTWSSLFEVMETLKQRFELEDYAVSDTTLDQIFIAFARGQQESNQ